MNRSYIASIGVLLAALSSAAPVSAQMMASQVVKINGCTANKAIAPQTYTDVFGGATSQPATPAVLMIDFQNTSQKSISAIEFGYIQDGKVRAMVRDVGMFTPDADVMHAYSLSDASIVAYASTMSCVPLRVKYADGSMWMNSDMPQK